MNESRRWRKLALSCISLVKMSEMLYLILMCETEIVPSGVVHANVGHKVTFFVFFK